MYEKTKLMDSSLKLEGWTFYFKTESYTQVSPTYFGGIVLTSVKGHSSSS